MSTPETIQPSAAGDDDQQRLARKELAHSMRSFADDLDEGKPYADISNALDQLHRALGAFIAACNATEASSAPPCPTK